MKPLMQFVDVCIGNEEDAELCLGFKPDADVEAGHTDAEGYKGIFQQMMKEFGFKYVVSTLRESFSATHNGSTTEKNSILQNVMISIRLSTV